MTESSETSAKLTGNGDDEPVGLCCLECGTLAAMLIDETQAFCDADGCRVLKWDPTMTRAEMAATAGIHEIDLSTGREARQGE